MSSFRGGTYETGSPASQTQKYADVAARTPQRIPTLAGACIQPNMRSAFIQQTGSRMYVGFMYSFTVSFKKNENLFYRSILRPAAGNNSVIFVIIGKRRRNNTVISPSLE